VTIRLWAVIVGHDGYARMNFVVDLAIVIVNYNVRDLLQRCLQSIFVSQGEFSFKVCVVDNNSHDASVEMVTEEFPQVAVIANDKNVGYPAANNQGLRHLGVDNAIGINRPRYCLLLNPDTELPPHALIKLLTYLDSQPPIGILGPKLVKLDGKLDLACRRSFPSPEVATYRMLGLSRMFSKSQRFGRYNLTYLDEDETAKVDSVVGAFMMVRTEAIDEVGLMDERFWMYGEDLDWAKRIKDRGWEVVYYPEVTVLHVKRASSRQYERAQVEFYRAMLIFYYKHYYQQTPRYLHWLILAGIALKGGRPIFSDLVAGEKILEPVQSR
jgi:N-acetylglucosaminyl-diphospho-decaprenol L-rhamnosyltransferase